MKIEDCAIGMRVLGTNMFGTQYIITEVKKTVVTVEHRTGLTIMQGGKRVPEVFTYKGVRPSGLTLVSTEAA